MQYLSVSVTTLWAVPLRGWEVPVWSLRPPSWGAAPSGDPVVACGPDGWGEGWLQEALLLPSLCHLEVLCLCCL